MNLPAGMTEQEARERLINSLSDQIRQDGFRMNHTIPIRELDADALSQMCHDFRAGVFTKAGKPDPEMV